MDAAVVAAASISSTSHMCLDEELCSSACSLIRYSYAAPRASAACVSFSFP